MTTESDRYVLRPGRASDAVELARLHASVQLQTVTGGQPHAGIAAWVEDLLDGHPSVVPDDFLVAEDSATGRPAGSLVGLRQQWSVAGVRLPVAQVELVGTAPEHRGNRLTRRRPSRRPRDAPRGARASGSDRLGHRFGSRPSGHDMLGRAGAWGEHHDRKLLSWPRWAPIGSAE